MVQILYIIEACPRNIRYYFKRAGLNIMEVIIMYPWDLRIIETEGCFVFTAVSENGSSFTIDDEDIGSGTHRIINLIVTDCPGAVIYVADLTGNTDLVESIMQIRKVAYVID